MLWLYRIAECVFMCLPVFVCVCVCLREREKVTFQNFTVNTPSEISEIKTYFI